MNTSLSSDRNFTRPKPSGHPSSLFHHAARALALLGLLGWLTPALAEVPQAVIRLESSLKLTNSVSAVHVAGSLAYLADGEPGLQIVDLSNPANPRLTGRIATGAAVRDIFVAGNLAYLAASTAGLQIFNVADPANPTLIRTFDTPSEARAVKVVGNTAYLANGGTGLHILDVTDPANPVQLGRYDSPGNARDVAVKGTLAYLADEAAGVQVVDVSDPSVPVRRANFDTPDWAIGIEVVGDVAYVADDTTGLLVLDVKDVVPLRVGEVSTDGLLRSIHVEGKHAWVSGTSSGAVVFDVSDPTNPQRVGAYRTTGGGAQLQAVGDRVYVADGFSGLSILGVRFGLAQRLVSEDPSGVALALQTPYPLHFALNSGLPLTLQVEGPIRLVEGVLTATNLGAIRIVIDQPGNAEYLPLHEVREFNLPGLQVTPLGAFQGFSEFGVIGEPDWTGNLAWLAEGIGGLVAFDVSDPRAPVTRGSLSTTSQVNAVQVIDSIAYLSAGAEGLVLVDVSKPGALVRLGSLSPRDSSRGIHVVDGLAYIADGTGGLTIAAVTNPAVPIRLNATQVSTNVESVRVAGRYAYLGRGFDGFSVIDVLDPTQPAEVGTFDPAGYVHGVRVVGTLAYVAAGADGLLILDVADPTQIRQIGRLDTPGSAAHVEIVGDQAFVSDLSAGVLVVDIQDPTAPRLRGSFGSEAGAQVSRVVGQRVLVGSRGGSWAFYDLRFGSPQSLSWQFPAAQAFGAPAMPLRAPSTSGLTPSFSVVQGPARIVGNTVVFTGIGRVRVRAEQPGDTDYLPSSADHLIHVGLPELRIENASDDLVLSWPAGLTNAILQGLESLAPGVAWKPAALPQTESAGEVHVRPGEAPFRFFRLQGFPGEVEPLRLTGWNRDVVQENSPTRSATAVDRFGANWFEAGLEGFQDGLPANRTIISQLTNSVLFELQPYTGSNVLALNAALRTSSLQLVTPTAYSRLHVLAHSAGGGGDGRLRIYYADGTTSALIPFFSPDWWDGSSSVPKRNPAIDDLARSQTAGFLTHDKVTFGFSLHQTDIDLTTGPDAGKPIIRLEFIRNLSAEVTCIFAVSGVPIPTAP